MEIRHDKSIIGETPHLVRNENLRFSGSFDNISLSEYLSNLRQKNLSRLLLAHININSIRNKFSQLVSSIKNNINILMTSETKTYNSFPTMQFHIEGYCIYRLDRHEYGGGILVYMREDIPSKLIPMQSSSIEGFFIELNLRCKKWLLSCSYNPHRSLISEGLSIIGKDLDLLSANYDQILLMGDFNSEPHDHFLMDLCDVYNLNNLIKVPTCFKNLEKLTSIDLMLTNSYRSFQSSWAIETGLSDFQKMIVTILKTNFQKKEPKIIQLQDDKKFSVEEYREFLINLVSDHDQCPSYDVFLRKCKIALDRSAPLKYKYLRSNDSPFMNKDISKAIMDRARLRNKFLRSRSIEDRNAYNNKEITVFHLFVKLKKIITTVWIIRRLLATSLFGNISNHCRRKTNARSNNLGSG